MKTYNFCKKIDVSMKIALDKWAKRLDAEEMTIHKDGTVTLMCADGCICESYRPTFKELYKKISRNRASGQADTVSRL